MSKVHFEETSEDEDEDDDQAEVNGTEEDDEPGSLML